MSPNPQEIVPVSTVVVCPNCKAKCRAPEDVDGKKIKCPGCTVPFRVQFDDLDDPAPRERRAGWPQTVLDFLLFRRMLASIVLVWLYWAMVALSFMAWVGYCVVLALDEAKDHPGDWLRHCVFSGIATVAGCVLWRFIYEFAIVVFRVSDSLTEIKHKL